MWGVTIFKMPKKGYKQTQEHKDKINIKERSLKISKYHSHYWLGKKQTQEHKDKIVVKRRGNESYKRNKGSFKKGDKPQSYIDGRSKLATMIRTMREYFKWRAEIFKRDNYHCQECGEKGYLEAHHVIPFIKILREFKIENFEDARKCKPLWDVGNGISYCRNCHIKEDFCRGFQKVVRCNV